MSARALFGGGDCRVSEVVNGGGGWKAEVHWSGPGSGGRLPSGPIGWATRAPLVFLPWCFDCASVPVLSLPLSRPH